MEELIQQLMANAGLTEEQARKAAETTRDFVKTKVPPPMSAMVDNFFAGSGFNPASAMQDQAAKNAQAGADFMSKSKAAAQEAGDKITDFTHTAIDKSADMAKEATKKMNEWGKEAGDAAEDAMNKLKDFFHKGDEAAKGETPNQ